MYRPSIQRGNQELERFHDLETSLDREIELEKERQKTERLRLVRHVLTLAIVLSAFGGAVSLGQDGLTDLKDLVIGLVG